MTTPFGLLESLVDTSQHPARFTGSGCLTCGAVAFPPRTRCAACAGTDLKAALIEPAGELYSYSIVHLARPGVTVPYALAVADFPGRVRVFARVLGWENGIAIGQRVVAAQAPDGERTGIPGADFRLLLTDGKADGKEDTA
jgi:uncharacterized OB-fold protein